MSTKPTVIYENNGFHVQLPHLFPDKFAVSIPLAFGAVRAETTFEWSDWPALRDAIDKVYVEQGDAEAGYSVIETDELERLRLQVAALQAEADRVYTLQAELAAARSREERATAIAEKVGFCLKVYRPLAERETIYTAEMVIRDSAVLFVEPSKVADKLAFGLVSAILRMVDAGQSTTCEAVEEAMRKNP